MLHTKGLIRVTSRLIQALGRPRASHFVFASALAVFALLSQISVALAFFGGGGPLVYVGPTPNSDFKTGYVLARSVVLDPDTNEPILVEFGADGKEIAPINISGDYKTSDLTIYPAADYRFQKNRLNEFREQYKDTIADDAELLSRREFEQAQFLYADNETVIQQGELPESVNSVLVRAQKSRFVPIAGTQTTPNEILVLLSFDIDLTQQIEINEQDQSLVVNEFGYVLTQSKNTIGYRVGFFGDPNSPDQPRTGRIDRTDDTVYGPVPFAKVFIDELVYPGSVSVSANDGRYSFKFYMGMCPLGGFSYSTDVTAELSYRNFLPTGSPSIPYYIRTPGYSYCFAQLVPSTLAPEVIAIQATTATPLIQTNLYVDVMFLTGRIALKNSQGQDVPIGDTTYTTFEEPAETTTQTFFDFNGDGRADHVERGRLLLCEPVDELTESKDIFLSDSTNSGPLTGAEGEILDDHTCAEVDPQPADVQAEQGGPLQGVFFSGSQSTIEDFPDLVRVIDTEFRNEEIGVLKEISVDDMRNTDVYVFRESTGQLILERRGLKQQEAEYRPAVAYDEEKNKVAYRIMLRGNRDWNLNVGGGVDRRQSFEDWATEYQLTEPFQQREADHPRPGEFVKIVAINRATGYTGTARVQLSGAGNSNLLSGLLDVETPEITMQPPKLKIWAERNYEIESGLTEGEERNYTIGNEGAALASDTSIRVFTEWLDEDGRPLPDELGLDNGAQYGLTGRLAKVVGTNQLRGTALADDMAEFPISPGRNTQVLRVGNGANASTDHFYIHVIGKPKEQECVSGLSCPNFDTTSNDPGLAGRPSLLTPFLTPLWDEQDSWLTFRAYLATLNGYQINSQDDADDLPVKPLPTYQWQYRPEYQFSQYDFTVGDISREFEDPESNDDDDSATIIESVLNSDAPIISTGDELVNVFYEIIGDQFDRLTPIDGDRQLILSLGGNESVINVGDDGQVTFDNLDAIANLSSADLLSIRLYTNNDEGNTLWQYQYEAAISTRFTRTISLAKFNSSETTSGSIEDVTDSFQVLQFRLNEPSMVDITLLNQELRPLDTLVSSRNYEPGDYGSVVTYEDLESSLEIDEIFYIAITKTGNITNETTRVLYTGTLAEKVDSEILGQIIEHDTLIQRGSLTLRREDIRLSGVGPQLDFIRSYSNEQKLTNDFSTLGPGWNHNHNIYLKVLSKSDSRGLFDNNLPIWIQEVRSGGRPEIVDINAFPEIDEIPQLITVSNGGMFVFQQGTWRPSRGFHGSLVFAGDHYEYTSKDGTTYVFDGEEVSDIDDRFMLNRVVDRNGNTLSYEYESFGFNKNVTRIKDQTGRSLSFQYEQNEDAQAYRLSRVSSREANIELNFEYSGTEYNDSEEGPKAASLIKFSRDNFVEQYGYALNSGDNLANLTSTTDAVGNVTQYRYMTAAAVPNALLDFAKGTRKTDVVASVEYPGETGVSQIEYLFATGNQRQVTDLNGNTTLYTLNEFGNPNIIDEPNDKRTQMVWTIDRGDDDVLIAEQRDALGRVTTYEYDGQGNVTKSTDPIGVVTQTWNQQFSLLEQRTDRNGNTITNQYDDNGNLLSATDAEGYVTRYTYTSQGLLKTARHPDNGGTTTYTYDSHGNLESKALPEGSVYRYTNDARGNVTETIDANGNDYAYDYDALDRLINESHPDGGTKTYQYDAKGNKLQEQDKLGLTLNYEYDARDRVVSVTRNFGGGSQTFTYDNQSNVLTETDWLGNITTHEYDTLYRRTKTTNRIGDSMSMTYDLVDNMLTKKDYRDLESSYVFDSGDRMVKSINRLGDEMLYTYDKENNVLTSTDYEGRLTQYTYDKRYLRTVVTNALGDTAITEYDGRGNAVQHTDEEGRVTKTIFDRQNRPTSVEDALKYVTTTDYDDNGNVIARVNRRGRESRYEYDELDRLVKTIDQDNFSWANTYDFNGNITASTDGRGNETTYQYDQLNRLVRETTPVGGNITHSYDSNNNLLESNDAIGTIYRKVYDKLDRLISEEEAATTSARRTKTTTYDPNGNVIAVNNFRGFESTYQYDDLDRLTVSTDALAQITRHSYDKVDNKLSTTNRRGFTTSYAYDDLNRLSRTTDALGQTIVTTYDGVGNAIVIRDKRGTNTINEFDALNRLLVSSKPSLANNLIRIIKNEYDGEGNLVAISDANNNRSRYEYNGRNLQTRVINPDGTSTTQEYDGAQNVTRIEDEIGQSTVMAYDAANRLISSTNFANETSSFGYDLNNNKLISTQPLGNSMSYVYDALNRVVEVSDGENNRTSYTYDNSNNQLTHTDANGNQVSYLYDALERRIRHTQPNGLITTSSYDPENNMVGRVDQNGQSFSYQFDAIDRQVRQTFPDAGSSYMRVQSIVTGYDANNNPVSITETKLNTLTGQPQIDVSSMAYDLLDRKTQETQRGHEINYVYDDNGNRLSVSSQAGNTDYNYDSRNRLIAAITENGPSTYQYTGDSKQQQVSYANGTVTRYTYDDADRILSATNEFSGLSTGVISSFIYTYDANSNRTSQVETQNGFASSQQQTTEYTYDNTNRMTGFTITDQQSGDVQALSYTFDNNYNRIREVETRTSSASGTPQTTTVKDRTSVFDENNRLISITDQLDPESKQIDYIYDNNGNTLSKVDNTQGSPQTTTFEYDSRNQLTATIRGPPEARENLGYHDYNFRGFRVRHINSERGDIEYIYDDKSILEERTLDSETLLAHYRYSDRLISLSTDTDEQYYHYSALRTTANLTDDDGAIAASYRTDVWGQITQQEGSSPNRQVFTGQEHDEKTGLIYFGARFYDPDTARFINQDSYLGESLTPPSLHRYLYAYGNPTVWVDPTGNYNEAGHYYTSFMIASRSGYSVEDAAQIAMYSQIPDEVSRYDAIARAGDEFLAKVLSVVTSTSIVRVSSAQETSDRQRYQEGLHVLTNTNADDERDRAIRVIESVDRGNLSVIGTAMHPLADSFAHRDLSDETKTYSKFVGHLKHNTKPDQIHRRKELFDSYIETGMQTLSDKTGKTITVENVEGLQRELWTAVDESRKTKTILGVKSGHTYDIADHDATNAATVQALRNKAITEIIYRKRLNPNDPKSISKAESYLLKPEANGLDNHGVGKGRGHEREQIESLLNTRKNEDGSDIELSKNDIDKVEKNSETAADYVSNSMNTLRANDEK